MAITKDHAMAAGVIVAVAMGAANLMRGPAVVPEPQPDPSAAAGKPAPPSHCKQACETLAKSGCVAGGAVSCEHDLHQFEAASADGGPHFSCSEPITRAWLDSVNWCPVGVEAGTMFRVKPTVFDNIGSWPDGGHL